MSYFDEPYYEEYIEDCPKCMGTGREYFNSDGEDITEDEYNALPDDERGSVECEQCQGEKYIVIEPCKDVEFEHELYL